ncbi:uncharacterized protein LOC105697569 isoform X2 [Orussus abietinus]|uniref:uncharacterized protein LOC105697569 isoform X2 n=1 Tax=Orussus abietinus TaxID=222816 RepID=UPI000625DE5E|nr:uncharacterized protein LOC105697569 isoform X2 [Orussus abietinus]
MMLVLLLCVIMKIAEFSVGRTVSAPLQVPVRPSENGNRKRQGRHRGRKSVDKSARFPRKRAGGGAAVMEDPQTPGSDCNSNPATDSITQDLVNSEFIQDNSEYQWFVDYSYRDGALPVHPSVLTSLSASYTQDDLGYYDDLVRNLDANLAEVDMESFRTADIHTLFTALPVMCTDPVQHSEGEDSACSTTDTISICKSSLLFSPVKETPVLPPGGSYSVDSLDCEDMLLTCQANNKNNYTIAFEGSIAMYSDGFQDSDTQEKQKLYDSPDPYYDEKLDLKNILDLSMACSDSKIYTTWSNLKRSSMNNAMTRHPSGNNNTIPNFLQGSGNIALNSVKRSQSLPDLTRTRDLHINVPLNFSVDSAESNNHAVNLHSSGSVMSRSMNEDSSESVENASTGKKLQNLSLVRLFMKQKSTSAEGMSLTLDQSDSVSDGGWLTTNSSDSGTHNTNTQIQRHNINSASNHQHSGNDFSINWVKADQYNNGGTESFTEAYDDGTKKASSLKEYNKDPETDPVDELSESLTKSLSTFDSDRGTREHQEYHSKVHMNSKRGSKGAWKNLPEKKYTISRTTGIQANAEVEDNAVQTSLVYPMPEEKSNSQPAVRETILNKTPVYVVYPNYALPDLSFLNSKDSTYENVALKPQGFDKGGTDWKRPGRSSRPFSCNDIDALKQRGFSHVKDWESLTFLLPIEYKKILHDVPEVPKYVRLSDEVKKPLFCLSPPMRHRTRTLSEILPNNTSSSSSTTTQPSSGYRGSSTILTDSANQQGSTNNATNPLYLYRYDSISSEASLMCQDSKSQRPSTQSRTNFPALPKRSISLPHGEKSTNRFTGLSKIPPRPPLPRSILRKNRVSTNKRYSMFEMGGVEEVEDQSSTETNKRMSLQEPYCMNNDMHLIRRGRIIDSEKDIDEVEERYYAERLKEAISRGCVDAEIDVSDNSEDDVKQLEEFLKRSGFSSQSSDGDRDDLDIKLRSYVRKFLALKMNKDVYKNVDMLESQKKSVSFAVHQRRRYLDNKANEVSGTSVERNNVVSPNSGLSEIRSESRTIDLDEKKKMMKSTGKAVDLLLKYWNSEPIQSRQGYNDKNECSQICLSNLCPSLYAIMSDGLKPHLNSTFGPITNSVWQVVEASSQQGPLTKTLNELVQKINGEDFITEGMLKFHAFVFGLLNLRALDAWFAYLCTRESILRKHYTGSSLFVDALSSSTAREVVETFLEILQPLSSCPFQLDLLYQYRQLHNSFGNTINTTVLRNAESPLEQHSHVPTEGRTDTNASPKKIRPRSYVAPTYDHKQIGVHKNDLDNLTKKRWSHLGVGSKVFQALDKVASEDSEEYTDSLEHSPLNRASSRKAAATRMRSPDIKAEDEDSIPAEFKFKKLHEKWELMISNEEQAAAPAPPSPNRTPTSIGKSKIPRLLPSPTKQPCNLPLGTGKSVKSPVSGIPTPKKVPAIPTAKGVTKKPDLRGKDTSGRTSRVDQDTVGVTRNHLMRPSSLPYKSHGVTAKEKNTISPHRRAASTSLPRPTSMGAARHPPKPAPKEVRTLTHRLPSDNGHLSFGEGEKLKVILEVDKKWLLCAKGERKGLVPRDCVVPVQT